MLERRNSEGHFSRIGNKDLRNLEEVSSMGLEWISSAVLWILNNNYASKRLFFVLRRGIHLFHVFHLDSYFKIYHKSKSQR